MQIKELKNVMGTDRSARLYMTIDTETPESSGVVLEYTIKKRMPITDLQEADKLYEKLTGNGSRFIEIEDLI